jgi:hypothetical protein
LLVRSIDNESIRRFLATQSLFNFVCSFLFSVYHIFIIRDLIVSRSLLPIILFSASILLLLSFLLIESLLIYYRVLLVLIRVIELIIHFILTLDSYFSVQWLLSLDEIKLRLLYSSITGILFYLNLHVNTWPIPVFFIVLEIQTKLIFLVELIIALHEDFLLIETWVMALELLDCSHALLGLS